VVIGRNEGERLRRCLAGLGEDLASTVYVDSGSSDGSVSLARALGVEVVALDGQRPFTAARARNAGLARLRELVPDLELVQFLDGDCVMAEDWLVRARSAMAADASLAVVCGRRRERFPDATVYNLLCDIEWNAPPGLAQACGGDALMRIGALVEAGGYDESMIAGEEPELCLRLRQRGHRILRIAADMTLHDAHITHFAQWWKRTVRSGHAYAEGFAMHRRDPGGFWAREVRSNFAWGLLLPLCVLALSLAWVWLVTLALAAYPMLALRVLRAGRRRGLSSREARLWASFVVLGKLPSALGQCQYYWRRWRGRRSLLIEYKGAASKPSGDGG
jgi:GT2 family glycosyltransferase